MKNKLILIGVLLMSFMVLGAAQLQAKPAKARKVVVQLYTLNKFTFEESIAKLKGLDIDGIEPYPGQRLSEKFPNVKFDENMNDEQKAFVRELLADAKLKMVSMGNANPNNDDKNVRKYMAFCQEFGIKNLISETNVAVMERWEKTAPEYDGVVLAIHNHGKSSSNQYWDPFVMMRFIKDKKYVAGSPDVGHWKRAGIDPIEGLKTLKGKMVSIHFKDVDENGKDVVFGTGVNNVKGMLAELDAQKYDGFFVIEYENEWENNIPSVKKCIEFLRAN